MIQKEIAVRCGVQQRRLNPDCFHAGHVVDFIYLFNKKKKASLENSRKEPDEKVRALKLLGQISGSNYIWLQVTVITY